jgi:uncharacterized protein with NAD-binding domain and iron-sulfur cluster
MAAARKVMIDGFAGARHASDVWVPKRPLSEIFGGSFRQPLSRRGVRFELGKSVRGLDWDDANQCWRIECSNGGSRIAEQVVLATPWHVSRRWFPELWKQQHGVASSGDGTETPFASSPITGIHLWLDRSLTALPHVVMVGTLTQWFFQEPIEKANPSPRTDGGYHQVVLSGRHAGSDWPKEKLVAEVVRELAEAFPESGLPRIRKFRVVTDPHAVFCVSPATQVCRPESKTSHPGLHLAGDAVATGWPATMEGAAISGQMAAKSVVESLESHAENGGIEVPVGLKRGWLARRLIR